eukprot:10404906-Heterocapsa_arctica.AAC.1
MYFGVAVVVAVLSELGWVEDGPFTWIIDGSIYDLRKDSPNLIEQLAIQHATEAVWKKEAKGQGSRRVKGHRGLDHSQEDDEAAGKEFAGQAGTLRNILAGG